MSSYYPLRRRCIVYTGKCASCGILSTTKGRWKRRRNGYKIPNPCFVGLYCLTSKNNRLCAACSSEHQRNLQKRLLSLPHPTTPPPPPPPPSTPFFFILHLNLNTESILLVHSCQHTSKLHIISVM